MEPAIYTGAVRHRRFRPVTHKFTYRLFMVFLDVDRIPELMRVSPLASYNRFNWASFDERDHFGDSRLPLRARLAADAAAQGVELPAGPIYLLTHLRYFGYNFNPVSFYYFYDQKGALQVVLAEVNSTFGETCNYWLRTGGGTRSFGRRAIKKMHVSPFLGMDLEYHFVIRPPDARLAVHMSVLDAGVPLLDATLALQRRPWSAPSLHRALLAHPWMSAKVIAAIHWEALRLCWKKAPFFPHPGRPLERKPEGR